MGILIFLGVEAVVNSFQKKEKGVNFLVNPGWPIKPGTRSFDRVNFQTGFNNYGPN